MADAHGSGPCESNLMRVQVPSPAQEKRTLNVRFFVQEKYLTFPYFPNL